MLPLLDLRQVYACEVAATVIKPAVELLMAEALP